MKNNVDINLPKDQIPLPDTTPTPGHDVTQKNIPRMSSKERGEVITDSEGRRFRNGVELFYESEIDKDNDPSGANLSASTTANTTKLPESTPPGLLDRINDSTIRPIAKQVERLEKAVHEADWNLAEKLISQNAELITKVQQRRSSLLLEAIINNLPDIAETLIASGASPHYKNSKGETALMLASEKGYLSLVEKLIQKGAVINQQKNDGQTALMLAAKNGHREVVELLILNGASVHLKSKRHSALTIAGRNGHLNVAELLIRKGLPVNSTSPDGWNALMFSARENHRELAKFLIGKGADVNLESNDRSALMLAAENGHLEIAELLIREGAKVDNESDERTALMYAAESGHLEMAELLIRSGADVNQLRREQWTALIIAAKHGHTKIAELLIRHGAKLDKITGELISPLDVAIRHQKTEIIDFLLPILIKDHHKNPKQDFQAELGSAIEDGYTKSLSTLFKHGIKIEPKTNTYIWQCILVAVVNGHTEVIKKLMDEFSPSLPLSNSWITGVDKELFYFLQSSLDEAVKNGNHEIARLMIKAGAKTDQVNRNKKTLLQIAVEKRHTKTIELLLEHRLATDQGKSNKNFHELLIALNQPSPDSMIVDILLEHQFKAAVKEGSFSYNHPFDDLSNHIHTEFMTQLNSQRKTKPEQRLMGYLCAELGFRHMIALAVITSARNAVQIYVPLNQENNVLSTNQKNEVPSAGQLKIAFAEHLASSQTLNDLMRDDNPAPETIYANHAEAPELAKTLARTTTLQASLLLLTAAEASQKQQAALSAFLDTLKSATPALKIREFMQETGWHPLLVNLLTESWEDLQQNKTRERLLLAIRRQLDTVEFAEKTESLPSDASRHLLTRQAERLSEIIKLLN